MAVVNLAIDPSTRQLSLADYFEPYEYISMDGGDQDLGSGGICGLDATTFKGNNVAHIGVTVGKNGKAYVVDMDNLGGFKNGANGGDLVIQTLPMPGGGPIFGGAGSYPLEGGWLYMTPIGYATQVYKFVPDAQGNPSFTQFTQTPDVSSGRVGAGAPTITTNGGQPGTAILWVTDIDAGLRAYYAVPQPDGSMKKINMPSTPAINKYQRPAFGDGRLYLSTSDGHIICLGSPVAQPFTCSVPIDFGSVTFGSTSTLMINCTANIPVTNIIGLTLTNPLFTALNSSLPTGSLSTGQNFSFPATFNLTSASIQETANTSYSGVKPGVASGDITLYTVNGITGYSTSQPLALSGETVSQTGFLSLSPVEVDFGGLVVNSTAAESGLSGSLIISNIGLASLTITGSAWSNLQSNTPAHTNITQIGTTNQYTLGPAFNATNWPQPGYIIAGGASISVTLNFVASTVGTYGSLVTIWSTGASSQNVILSGSMSNAPVAVLTVDNGEGGAWQPDITGTSQDPSDGSPITGVGVNFGNLYPGNSTIYSE
jgi:iron transport multicopper oxidase